MLLFFKKKIIMIELLDSVFINLVWKHLHEVRGPCIYLMFGSSWVWQACRNSAEPELHKVLSSMWSYVDRWCSLL